MVDLNIRDWRVHCQGECCDGVRDDCPFTCCDVVRDQLSVQILSYSRYNSLFENCDVIKDSLSVRIL